MAADLKVKGIAIVIMGVSGSGKSTVAQKLSESLGCSFFEADDFHSQENKEKMRNGIPLSDEDRIPWLEALRDATMKKINSGETAVLTCSALQKKYREILRSSDQNYHPGDYTSCKVKFVCLKAPKEVIAERIRRRSKEGNHFMPESLLQSQLDLLQVDEAEGITIVNGTESFQTIVDDIITLFRANKSNHI
ncbi:uncharacterized protein A4U43_C08F910 [Asparagus officinalis]|uniref:probable gluconokinase n=1 Tax=Asparagus officinalis TaxID=4686 RepID=UPI00098E5F1C|nr:probable gluconokinase [Asparagus officinalis]ONK58903.1 uncharacterized protein A4U43_C08F910 [Asparagus officinalis]